MHPAQSSNLCTYPSFLICLWPCILPSISLLLESSEYVIEKWKTLQPAIHHQQKIYQALPLCQALFRVLWRDELTKQGVTL